MDGSSCCIWLNHRTESDEFSCVKVNKQFFRHLAERMNVSFDAVIVALSPETMDQRLGAYANEFMCNRPRGVERTQGYTAASCMEDCSVLWEAKGPNGTGCNKIS